LSEGAEKRCSEIISARKTEKTPADAKTTTVLITLTVQTRNQQTNLAKSEALMQYCG
jgi:hypothetical protein